MILGQLRLATLAISATLCTVTPVLADVAAPGNTPMHSKVEIPEGKPIPTVQLVIHPDSKEGWNLEIRTTNFRFAPERVNQPGSFDEGHIHLYVDGKKIGRVYGAWYHLKELPTGIHRIGVSLNNNTHDLLTYKGEIISDEEMLVVPEKAMPPGTPH